MPSPPSLPTGPVHRARDPPPSTVTAPRPTPRRLARPAPAAPPGPAPGRTPPPSGDAPPRFAAERQQRIAAAVQSQGGVEVAALAQAFGVSADTVRRDLRQLEAAGVLLKAHGGAVAPPTAPGHRAPARQRAEAHGPAKQRIAHAALAQVRAGQTLFIDAGSTTLALAQQLRAARHLRPLTVLTHGLDVALELSEEDGVHLVLAGGDWVPHERHFVGAAALAALRDHRADIAFLAACAVHERAGVTVEGAADAACSRAMLEGAARRVLLADASKLGRIAPCAVASLDEIDLVISEAAPAWLGARTAVDLA